MTSFAPSKLPWPIEPITSLNILKIGGEYVFFIFFAGIIGSLAQRFYFKKKRLHMEKPINTKFTLVQVILAGPIEEMGFRGTAYLIADRLGLPVVPVLYIANGVWAGYHLRSFVAFIYVFVFGIYLTKFWYFGFHGMWWMAIIMHSVHNVISYTVQQTVRQ